jgi:hypothetical protein
MKLKETKLGKWFRDKSPDVLEAIGELVPGGEVLKALGVLIDKTTESEAEKEQARLMLQELENADRASARNREVEVTKALGKRDYMQMFVGVSAMLIGIALVIWAKNGVEDKEIFFHILGFAEGTLVGQVVNYYFGSSQK